MIAQNEEQNVVLTNSTDSHALQMEASAEAFAILSSDIYQYKIAAVVRELCCNAWDAHLDAGHRKPFHLTFPSQLHPYFSIEDFGIGLDDEGVRHILTVYFKSTKKQKEESTGYLGLGAKSPLAYSDSFTVRSRKDGKEYHYSVHLDADNKPALTKMTEKDTTEGNGMKFTLPVRPRDFEQFFNDARFICSLFEVPPTSNRQDFEVLMPDIRSELDENGVYYPSVSSTSVSGLYSFAGYNNPHAGAYRNMQRKFVVMGNVAYPVENFFISDEIEVSDEIRYFANMMDRTIFLKMPMGSVKFTASRESLSLNDITRQRVTEAAISFYAKERNKYIAKIDACENAYDAIAECYKITNSTYGFGFFTYKGKKLSKYSRKEFHGLLGMFDGVQYTANSTSSGIRVSHTKFSAGNWHMSSLTMGDLALIKSGQSVQRKRIVLIAPREKTTGAVKYAREYARANTDAVVYGFKKIMTPHQVDRLSRTLNNAEVIWSDDLHAEELERRREERALLPKEKKAKTPASVIKAMAIRSHESYGDKFAMVAEYDISQADAEKVKYFYAERTDPLDTMIQFAAFDRATVRPGMARNVVNFIAQFRGYEKVVVLIANKTNLKKIEKNEIPSLESEMLKIKEEVSTNKDYLDFLVSRHIRANASGDVEALANILTQVKSDNLTPDIKKLDTMLQAGYSNPYNMSIPSWAEGDVNDKAKEMTDEYHTIMGDVELIKEQYYPLFNCVQSASVLAHYVRMVDLYSKVQSI